MKPTNFKKTSKLDRFLHWSIAFSMSLLFLTGFLRMTWMAKKNVVKVIESHVGNSVSPEQSKAIAKELLEPMWQWHEYAAYFILGVLIIKIIYTLFKSSKTPNHFSEKKNIKEYLQKAVYLLFYMFLAATTITGFYLKWGDGTWKEPMEAIHKLAIYWFPIFIGLHLIGIVIAELTNKKGIVSKMIGG